MAEPKISKNAIPDDISIDVKSRILKLYSNNPSERAKAAYELGEMGRKAYAAAPFLESMMDDTEPLDWWIQIDNDEMADTPGEEAEKALVKIGKLDVDVFIQELKNKNLSTIDRVKAINRLVAVKGDRAIKALSDIVMITDYDSDIQEACAEALGRIGDPRGVKALIAALKKRNFGRDAAVDALVKIGKPGVREIIGAMKSKNEYVRIGCAEALGKIRDARAVLPLIKALKDPHLHVRWKAVNALGNIGDRRASAPLIPLIKDKDMNIRWMTAEALGRIGDRIAVEQLISELPVDRDAYVREKIAWSLGEIGDHRAVRPLCDALKDNEMPVREAAAESIGKIRDHKSFKYLVGALKEEDLGVRKSVIIALGKLRDPMAISPLVECLKRERDVSEQVASAFAYIGEEAVGPSIQLLYDDRPYVRQTAIIALGKIKEKRAVGYLINMLDDRDLFVRSAAIEALRDITGMNFGGEMASWQEWWLENEETRKANTGKTKKSAPVA